MENTHFTQSDVYAQREPEVKIVEINTEIQRPVIVELTSKKYKGMILVSHLLFFLSGAFFFFTFSNTGERLFSHDTGASIAFVIFIASLILNGIGKFLAWWNHG